VKRRLERRDLLHQPVGQFLAAHHRQRRNIVNGFLGIKLGALAPRAVEHINDVRLQIEQPKLEHREQPNRARADYNNVSLVSLAGGRGLNLGRSAGGFVHGSLFAR
jgi:hypothetical protein